MTSNSHKNGSNGYTWLNGNNPIQSYIQVWPSYATISKLKSNYTPGVDQFLKERRIINHLFKENTQAEHNYKQYMGSKKTEQSFEVGDMVYLRLQHIDKTQLDFKGNLKSSEFYSPFEILQK